MIPGEIRTPPGEIKLNAGRVQKHVTVVNTGDRPVQVGSHAHFFEVNRALQFDRLQAYGMRLCIPSGTAVRFEPGEEKPVALVAFGGDRLAYGMSAIAHGEAIPDRVRDDVRSRLEAWEGNQH